MLKSRDKYQTVLVEIMKIISKFTKMLKIIYVKGADSLTVNSVLILGFNKAQNRWGDVNTILNVVQIYKGETLTATQHCLDVLQPMLFLQHTVGIKYVKCFSVHWQATMTWPPLQKLPCVIKYAQRLVFLDLKLVTLQNIHIAHSCLNSLSNRQVIGFVIIWCVE